MAFGIVFQGKGLVELQEFKLGDLGANQIHLQTRTSLISTGTEGICLNRLFDPGTHFDRWVKYPFRTGYCVVADVVAVGPDVTDFKVGDRVFTRVTHASEHIVDTTRVVKIPDAISDEEAQWSALAMIGSMILDAGDIRLQDDVAVVGAGPVGQMACRWLLAAGCKVTICDTVAMRLGMAELAGVTNPMLGTVEEFGPHVEQVFGAKPRVVVDCTGFASVMEKALAIPRNFGTVILLGDTGTPAGQHLTPDVLTRGVRVHGCHISHETADWHETRIIPKFYDLVQAGRFSVQGLNTHRFLPTDAVEAYKLNTERRAETMGVWFDWR
ncbi:MAG: zinc-binding dehydrogenase [Armatimonadetes bacterium]|nr:zinc-binding dehydrogenase [Armatimonadota bacterium]